ncbi:MAG: hypothetical protein FWG94_04080 [Oscillospiraceae bacterium]|nr:hypothetical protein [Oscillospiraceae bacterium]
MIEKLNVNGREVVQMPIEDYNAIMGFIETIKQNKDDYYRRQIQMAKQYLADGGPFISMDELFDYCKEFTHARQMKDAANE